MKILNLLGILLIGANLISGCASSMNSLAKRKSIISTKNSVEEKLNSTRPRSVSPLRYMNM